MWKEAPLLVLFLYFLVQATCLNVYNDCKRRNCEVRLRMDVGWMCGQVRVAVDGTKYASFKGVPYGKAPAGSRRFKELEPLDPWDESFLLDATKDAPACPQTDFFYGRIPIQPNGMSEDCIYLNVYAPYKSLPRSPCHSKGHGLPILVFIHGGAFQSGSGLSEAFGPDNLMVKPVIVITFNYRLNFFGFFCLDTKEIPCNQGLRDMVALLHWVQRNARNFGGDPNNVTLMGQSSGASSAHILSLSKVTKGLFKRVIMMSSTAFPSYYSTSIEHRKRVSRMYLRELGINQTDPVLIHRELTKLPLLKIMHANTALQFSTPIVICSPTVESELPGVTRILDEDPLILIARGRGREYPQLVSITDNETAFGRWLVYKKNIVPALIQDPTTIVSPRLAYTLPKCEVREIAQKIKRRYFNRTPTVDRVLQYFFDMIFKHPTYKLAQWRAATGGAPMYMYQFSYELCNSPIKAGHWIDYRGASHMDDLFCVFRATSVLNNYISCPPNTKDERMKYWMVHIITNFMMCSNPTCNKNIWPPVSKGKLVYNLIREPMGIHMMEPTREDMDITRFFDSFDPESRNITAFVEGK